MKREGIASDNQPMLAARTAQDEAISGEPGHAESIQPKALLERVLERENLRRALEQVRQNKGAPGIDGMTVDDLPEYLRHHWPKLRAQLKTGTYVPQRRNSKGRWENPSLGDSHGVRPIHPASHRADY